MATPDVDILAVRLFTLVFNVRRIAPTTTVQESGGSHFGG